MIGRWSLCALLAATLGGCGADQAFQVRPGLTLAADASWPDECSALPGYTEFRRALGAAVVARDAAALRALFHPRGSMRVNGIGSPGQGSEWGMERPEAAAVWRELDSILALGCVESGGGALLPAMARIADDGTIDTSYDMALTDLAVRSRPEPSASSVRTVPKGSLVYTIAYDNPPGWVVVLVDGREAYVRQSELRSPNGLQLQLARDGDRWSIKEFGGGI